MVHSEAYSIINALMEKNLIVIEHKGLTEWLDRLHSKGEIRAAEINSLLQLADQLQPYDVPGSEVTCCEEIPFLEWVQDRKYLFEYHPFNRDA